MNNELLRLKQLLYQISFAGVALVMSSSLLLGTSHHPKAAKYVSTSNHTELVPPVFLDPIPDNVTISCINDFPAPVILDAEAEDGTILNVSPVDNPTIESIDACTGGTITRTWTATFNGESSIATQIITIEADNDPPVLNIPEVHDTILCTNLDASNDIATWINDRRLSVATNASDACTGIDNIFDNDPQPVGNPCNTVTIVFTIVDECGSTLEYQSTYTLLDTVAPILSPVPADTIVGCDAVPAPPVVTATDDCSPVTPVLIEDTTFLACNYEYTLTRTWIATDSCMNADTAIQIIMVIDTVGPMLDGVAENDTLMFHCDELIPPVPPVTVADNCSPPDFVFTQDTIFEACPLNYTINRFWFVDDGCGRTDMARQTIIVTDTVGPEIIGVVEDTLFFTCADAIPPPNPNIVVDDNCSVSQLFFAEDTTFTGCQYEYTIDRLWTTDDGCGRTDTARQVIVVTDDIGPQIIGAPENDTLRLDCIIDIPPLPMASVQDNCGSPELVISQDTIFGACPQELMISRLWTVDDGCGRTDTARQIIFVLDTIAPVLNGVAAMETITLDCSEMVPAPPMVTANDNCIGAVMVEMQADTMLDASCPDNKFTITRTFTASDDCGNTAEAIQIIEVDDSQGPTFTVPPNITIDCTQNPNDLNITGDIMDVADNCDNNPVVSFSDNIIQNGGCPQSYQIQRRWRVRDACNNITGKIQIITVVDNQPPDFVVPPDVTVSCGEENNFAITGTPTNIMDNCDQSIQGTFTETVVLGPCVNSYTIFRTWSATDDCGNFTEKEQVITVVDNEIPTLTSNPQNLTVECQSEEELELLFNDWITTRGGADAFDNCSNVNALDWFAFESGTTDAAILPPANCPAPGGVLRESFVDFVVVDECGNQATETARFRVIDTTPPIITGCPQDTTIANTAGLCETSFTFFPPSVEENCAGATTITDLFDTAPITATLMPGGTLGTTPIDPVTFEFDLNALLPLSAGGDATLTINLLRADAEGPTEYLLVYGENGSLLGQTNPTNGQCGDSQTSFTISASQINNWGNDGTITITVEPFIPPNQSAAFAVNAICDPAGEINATLSVANRDVSDLRFEYEINDDGFQDVDPIDAATITLPVGMHTITYRLRDCGGNFATCSYQVNVVDTEPPVLSCPMDTTAILDLGECTALITLPQPETVSDNCGLDVSMVDLQASNAADSLITFFFDPNLPGYLAQDKTYNFPLDNAGLSGDVIIIVDYQGDFNTPDAFFTIKGENDFFIGETVLNVADCSTPNQQIFTVPANLINQWSQDGSVSILAEAKEIIIPGGQPGDGVNPCDPGQVNMDGDDDGSSYIKVTISYNNIQPDYFATGVTSVPFTEVTEADPFPAIEFGQGETAVSYVIADIYGNVDTCNFTVNVLDQEAPVALCQPTTLQINPSGLDDTFVDAVAMDAGSFDNCGGLDTLFISPNGFDCTEVGTTFEAELTVIDSSGNQSSCTEDVSLVAIKPMPTFSGGACAGDTLFLFTNPPPTPGVSNDIWTYQWSGPNFSSSQRNPFIPNVGPGNAGTYSVTVTGFGGCSSSAELQIGIENLPPEPEIFAELEVCDDEQLVLNANLLNNASSYLWYADPPGPDIFLGETEDPELILPAGQDAGEYTYYVIVETTIGCLSNASDPVTIDIVERPTAIAPPDTVICEGEELTLISNLTGVDYQWVGPNFSSNQQFAMVTDSAVLALHSGVYNLVVSRGDCASAPDQTVVTVLPKPAQPDLFSNGTLCEGEELILTTTQDNAETYQWIPPNGPVVENTATEYSIPVTDEDIHEGLWRLRVTQFGCESDVSSPINVIINPVPNTVGAVNDPDPCEGTNVTFTATPDFFPEASYVWETPNGEEQVGQQFMLEDLNEFDQGDFVLTITSPQGCEKTDTISLEVLPGVQITALSDNAPECLDGPTNVQLSATIFPPDLSNNYDYLWTNGNGFMNTNPVAVIPGATSDDSDNYSLVVTNQFGCVSEIETIEVELTDAPETPVTPFSIPINVQKFCEGDEIVLETDEYDTDVTYFWSTPNGPVTTNTATLVIDNASVLDSGAYTVYVEEGLCVSNISGTKLIDVNPQPVVEAASNSPVCSGDQISLSSTGIPNATYTWSGPVNPGIQNPVIMNADSMMHSGTYSVMATLENCISEPAEVEVVVFNRPDAPIALSTDPICIDDPGASLQLSIEPGSGTPGASYTWTGDFGTATVSDQTLNVTNFSAYNTDGVYEFTVQATLGICTSEQSEPALIELNLIPDGIEAMIPLSDTTNFCLEDAIQLQANLPTGLDGAWTVANGNSEMVMISDTSDAMTTATVDDAGFYTLEWSLSNGACLNFSSDQLTLNVGEAEEAIAGDDFFACFFDQNLLNATPPNNAASTGFWTQPALQDSFDIIIQDTLDSNTGISGLEPATYVFFWNVTSECGARVDTVFVTLSDLPDAGEDVAICDDFPVGELDATPVAPTSSARWSSLNPGVEISNPNNPMASIINLNIGENQFVWTVDNGACDDLSRDTVSYFYYRNLNAEDDNVVVSFGQERNINILENDDVPENSVISIAVPPAFGSTVINPDGTISYTPGPDYRGADEFTYEICNEGEGCGCVTAVVSLSLEGVECDAPSIITPNNDGINDTFVVPCLLNTVDFPDSRLIVFNRWGDEVYRSGQPYDNNWDGRYNGENLPVGTYFYVLEFNNGAQPFHGFVVIQR